LGDALQKLSELQRAMIVARLSGACWSIMKHPPDVAATILVRL
jgi:hypothetical protein